MSFLLAKSPKNHTRGPLPQLEVDALPDRPNVCPVVATSEYILRTSQYRNSDDDLDRSRLFLSLDSRHCNVKAGTISRWIQNGMELAGIDTAVFKAHSIRGASVSIMSSKGASLKDIMRRGRVDGDLIRF